MPTRRPKVDDQDIELFSHQWPLGDSVKLDPTVDRGTFRAQVSRLKQLGYQFDTRYKPGTTRLLLPPELFNREVLVEQGQLAQGPWA